MGPAEWRLAATMMTMLALAITGVQLVRSIWRGQAIAVQRYRSVLALEVVTGVLLSLPGGRDEVTVVASAIEIAPCLGTAGIALIQPHGERLTVNGVGQPAPTCTIWAIIEDSTSGAVWLQGPAVARPAGWGIELVLGIGEASTAPLAYRVTIVAADAAGHDAWQRAALVDGTIRLAAYPAGVELIAQRRVEVHRSGDSIALVDLATAR